MEYQELSATPPLDSIVRCFWFLRGHAGPEGPESVQTIVTDGRVEIILHLAQPFARLDEHGTARTQAAVLVSGQLTAPIHLLGRDAVDVVGIRFRTATSGAVLRVPLAELTDRVDPLSLYAPRLADALFTAASRHTTPATRADALSQVLIRFATRAPDALARTAIGLLDAPTAPRIGEVATRLGVSARTLERRVSEHSGLAPSTLRRVLRFRRVFQLLDQAPAGTWTQVAAAAGYFDQAHLIRDFRQFAGAPPGEFFRTDPELARAILSSDASSIRAR